MILSRSLAPSLVLGAAATLATAAAAGRADEYVQTGSVARISARCADLGTGFADVGNGVCARVAGHVRMYVRIPSQGLGSPGLGGIIPWTGGGTSNAAMRSYESGMVPGTTTQHLRIHVPLDASPYR